MLLAFRFKTTSRIALSSFVIVFDIEITSFEKLSYVYSIYRELKMNVCLVTYIAHGTFVCQINQRAVSKHMYI